MYVMQCIKHFMQGEFAELSPKDSVVDGYYRQIREALGDTVWTSGCQSWYLDDEGVPGLWPWTPQRYMAEVANPDFSEFDLVSG